MAETIKDTVPREKGLAKRIRAAFSPAPALGWLLGILAAVVLEHLFGSLTAEMVGLPKIPVLFGCVVMLKKPFLIPSILVYLGLIYVLPISMIARLSASTANRMAAALLRYPIWISVTLHLLLLYGILHIWSDVSAYRVLTLKLTLIAIIFTLSLNIINGYMGEFSCSHPGFMALGAYAASTATVTLFVSDKLFGPALLPPALGPFLFPLSLIFGGLVASLGALVIAIPSFRTRGDYLAIISLAFLFIVKSLIENIEFLGGPRGMSGQPDYASLPGFSCGAPDPSGLSIILSVPPWERP